MNLRYLEIDIRYMLHKRRRAFPPNHVVTLWLLSFIESMSILISYWSQTFPMLTSAIDVQPTKFGIFLIWFGTLSGLIEFPRDVTQ